MDLKVLQTLEYINSRLSNIEKNIIQLDEKLEFSISLHRNHLIRIKNGEFIDDNMILMGTPYNDISPKHAYQVWNNPDSDFFLLDVTSNSFSCEDRIKDAVHIPLEELSRRYCELQSKTTPILIISERGLRSIQASEMLVRKGFYNINNISGGYEYWVGKNRRNVPKNPARIT
jgi:rhodanese-related sulfurtransferase